VRNRVVITGLGTINPLGGNTQTTWENIQAGKSGIGPITRFDTNGFKHRIAAEVKNFDGDERFGKREARRMDRISQFSLVAAQEAMENANLVVKGLGGWAPYLSKPKFSQTEAQHG
jgi:3-oxoacyl-[acyl-carrier-protein] synthase II